MLLKLNLHATGLCTTNHPALSLSLRATHSFFGGRGGVVVEPHCPLQKTWVALPRLLSSQVLLSPSFVGQCWWQEWLPLVKWQQQTTSQTLSACWLVLSLISWISVTESVFACSIFKNFYFPTIELCWLFLLPVEELDEVGIIIFIYIFLVLYLFAIDYLS